MGYLRHWLFSFGGVFIGDDAGEIWQCGVRSQPAAGATVTYGDEDEVLAGTFQGMQDWFTGPDGFMRSDAELRYIKLNEIAPDGSYAGDDTHAHYYAAGLHGNFGANVPAICSCCFSWRTDKDRGLAHAGRIYPPLALSTITGVHIQASNIDLIGTSAQRLIHTMNRGQDGGSAYYQAPVIASKGKNNGTGPGVIEGITGIRIGNVVDVQRRRKNAAPETYKSFAMPTS